jgi:hypothetical protein
MKINKNNKFNKLFLMFLILIVVSFLLYNIYSIQGFQTKKIIQPKFYQDIDGPLNIVKEISDITPSITTETFTDVSMNYPSSYNIFTNNNINIPVYDQYTTNTCVANSISTSLAYLLKLDNPKNSIELPSRVFIYLMGKKIDYRTDLCLASNVGLRSLTVLNYLNFYKIPTEEELPFPVPAPVSDSGSDAGDYGSLCITPPESLIKYDNNRKLIFQPFDIVVQPADRINKIKDALFKNRILLITFRVFTSFFDKWNNNNGRFVLPTAGETFYGGHAMVIIGYNDSDQTLTVRNSWGNTGDNGNGYLPYEYVTTTKLYPINATITVSLTTGIYSLESYGTPHNTSLDADISDTKTSNIYYDYISELFRGNLFT